MTGAREGPGHDVSEAFLNSRLRFGIVCLIALKIGGLLLIVDPWSIQSSDLPKTIFSRGVAWVLAGAVVALIAGHGLTVVPRSPLHLAILGLLVANVASALAAENAVLAAYGDFPRFLGIGFVVDMVVLYLATAVAVRTPRDWGVITSLAVGALAVIVAYAIAQAVGLDPIRWTDDPRSRPFSTLGGPDPLGHVLSVFIGLAFGALVLVRHRSSRTAAASCFVLAVGAAAVVATRGTLVGFAAAVLMVVALWAITGRRETYGAVFAATLVLLVVLLLPASPLWGRAAETLYDPSGRGRLALYDISLLALRERPVLGYGVDNFGPAFVAHRSAAHYGLLTSDLRETSAHSWPLQAAVTTGLVGLAALLVAMAVSLLELLRCARARSAIAATLLVGSAAYWAHAMVAAGSVSIDWFPWFTAGAAVTLRAGQLHASGTAESHRRPIVVPIRALAIAIALAAALITGVPSVMASHAAWEARDAVQAREGFRAIAAASAATQLEHLRADHWNWLGLGYDIHARLDDEVWAFTRAAELAPHEVLYRVNAARAHARLGIERGSLAAFDDSRAALAIARAMDPNHPLPFEVQAEVDLASGRPEAALGQALVAYGLEPREHRLGLVRLTAHAVGSGGTALLMVTHALRTRETAALHVVAAELALAQGARDIARAHATRALALEPDRDDARRALDATGR